MKAATVHWDATHKTVQLKEGVIEKEGDAYGYLNDSLSQTGWSVLEILAGYGETLELDEVTYFLAGYLEGLLTQMISHYANMYPQLIKDPEVLGQVERFMVKQDSWTREQVKLNRSTDPLWHHTGFIVAQMDGLRAGVAHWAKKQGKEPLSLFAVQFLNAVGDLLDLIPALMLPGFENLLFSHSSWYTYASTMHIYKHWDFYLSEPHTATGKLSFSNYPGFLVSLDDFYLLGSGLMMTQTTNNVFNTSLFSQVTPHSLLAWQRVRLAHTLSHTGEQWAKTFSRYNSGEGRRKYMIVDMRKVTLGHSIEDGFSDQTRALRRGYWPSYNVPFHPKIYTLSGYGKMWEEYGEDFSYDLCPRAKIFRQYQAEVKDLDSLKHIMRYNGYRKDSYSKGDPCKSICCRNDLREKYPSPGGCYDTKVTDFHMAQEFRAEAVNGPTTQGDLPPFSWEDFNSTAHQGLPDHYDFPFISMQPALFMP
uniref:Phospholipase B-like n=1 Tax=Salmo trutta TaxID=8032 RepID=A0A674BTI8_SALTR